jgi:hypothetical protein
VVWALGVTMLRRSPRKAFMRVDFPALGGPTRVTYPHRVSAFSGFGMGSGLVIRGKFPERNGFRNGSSVGTVSNSQGFCQNWVFFLGGVLLACPPLCSVLHPFGTEGDR